MAAVSRRARSLHVTHGSVSNVIAIQDRAAAYNFRISNTVVPGDRLASRLTCRCRAQGKLTVADGKPLR